MLVMLIEGIGKNSASYIIHSAIHIPMIAVACPLTEKKLQKYAWFTGNPQKYYTGGYGYFYYFNVCALL
jgi:hypothetical protein